MPLNVFRVHFHLLLPLVGCFICVSGRVTCGFSCVLSDWGEAVASFGNSAVGGSFGLLLPVSFVTSILSCGDRGLFFKCVG